MYKRFYGVRPKILQVFAHTLTDRKKRQPNSFWWKRNVFKKLLFLSNQIVHIRPHKHRNHKDRVFFLRRRAWRQIDWCMFCEETQLRLTIAKESLAKGEMKEKWRKRWSFESGPLWHITLMLWDNAWCRWTVCICHKNSRPSYFPYETLYLQRGSCPYLLMGKAILIQGIRQTI